MPQSKNPWHELDRLFDGLSGAVVRGDQADALCAIWEAFPPRPEFIFVSKRVGGAMEEVLRGTR